MLSKSLITVRYAETDQMGIAHHSVYPVWYEVARTDWISKTGFSYSALEEKGILLPVLSLECHYHQPVYYEDRLVVTASLVKLSWVKMEFSYSICREGEEKPLHTGRTVHGIVDRERKPLQLRKEFPELYRILQNAVDPLAEAGARAGAEAKRE